MILSKNHVVLLLPTPIELAESAVAVAANGVLFAVFLPQQLQSEFAVSAQLLLDVLEIRLWTPINGCGFGSGCRRRGTDGIERGFDPFFIPVFWQRPGEAGGLRPSDVLVHGGLADACSPGDMPLAELLLPVQPENFFDLTHGLPLSGQCALAFCSARELTRSGVVQRRGLAVV